MTVQRWTDEMVDELAFSTNELKESTTGLRESVTELRNGLTEVKESITELRNGLTEVNDSINGLRVTSQALLQVAAQNQRDMNLIQHRQEETDQRFNILLEEVRYLIRGNKDS